MGQRPLQILLVMPGVGKKPGEKYVASWKMEPLGLATLAALTPPDIAVTLADDRIEPVPYDAAVNAVAINVETYSARRAYAVAARFRARGVPVILGGYHATLAPEEAMHFADAVIEGPAEGVWENVLEDLRNRSLQRRYGGGVHFGGPPVQPRRSLFDGKSYLPMTLVETGRGCRFGCEFCSVSRFFRRQAYGRLIGNVVAEIEAAGRQSVFFVDDNVVTDLERAKQLFAALVPSRIRWFSQGSLTMADDPALLKVMAQSGCDGVLIGFESLSAATLAAMGKSWNQAVRGYGEAVGRIRDAGIPIYATFVFGYDTDDAGTFDRTLDFAIGQRFSMAAFNHLVPFPGTPLYQRLRAEGRLRSDPWWLNPDYRFGDVAFEPRGMSAEELARRCYEARQAFYRFSSVALRACDFRANCPSLRRAGMYLWLNLFSGRQMRQRQGLPLGEGFDDGAVCPPLETMPAGVPA